MNDTVVTVVGNLVEDPRWNQTAQGLDVTNFRLASTTRKFDRETQEWVDAGSVYLTVNCWRVLATNVRASLRKGDPVVVHGRLFTRSWSKDGASRNSYEVDATAVGPDLARGTAVFSRGARAARPDPFAAVERPPERGDPLPAVAAAGEPAGLVGVPVG